MSFNRLHETIMELTVSDYVSGPSTDHAFKHHHVWVFGIDLDGNEIYIKLFDDFTGGTARCVSFHKAREKMVYPYR